LLPQAKQRATKFAFRSFVMGWCLSAVSSAMSAIARTLGILILTLPLCACYAEQKQAVAACQKQAFENFFERNSMEKLDYPELALSRTPEVQIYIANCMTAKGYVEDWSDRRCGSKLNVEANPYCYAPVGQLAFVAHKIESVFEP